MKNLEIEIKQINRIAGRRESCLYDVLKTIAAYLNVRADNIYINEFGFSFNYEEYNKSGLIGKSIKQNPNRVLENLKLLYGYDLQYSYFKSFEEELVYINNCLAINFPAIVHFDSFYLPWDPFNNRVHNNHVVLITGIDENNVNVVDPYFNKKNKIMSIESLKEASTFYMYFNEKKSDFSEINFKQLLIDNYVNKYKTPSSNYLDLEYFSRAILTDFSVEKEFTESVFDQNAIFKNLSDCVLRTGLFYEIIDYHNSIEKSKTLILIKDELKKIVKNWNDIITLIASNNFQTKIKNTKQIAELISDLAIKYEDILLKIKTYVNE